MIRLQMVVRPNGFLKFNPGQEAYIPLLAGFMPADQQVVTWRKVRQTLVGTEVPELKWVLV